MNTPIRPRPQASARGFVLIASLLILIVMSALGISMFRSVGVQRKIAGNLSDKGRAFQLAQSTLQYAEYLLAMQSASLPQTANCQSALLAATICQNPVSIQAPSSEDTLITLSNGATYSNMEPALDISTTGGADTYYANPQFYIQYLGSSGSAQVYQVTGLGYGGNPHSVAVVQSTYQLTVGTRNLGGL
jgi:type IV pilus assembly protein PilX